MSLEIFARQSLAQFAIIYGEIFTEGKGKAINPSEIETLMWGRMCAKEAGIVKTGFKIPYDNIKRAKVTIPYMPDDINYTGCCAIKKNGGLYTPCCGKVAEDAYYCKACSVDKDGDAKELEFGTTDDREQNVEDGRFAPITFAEWMKAHKNMSLPEVYAKLREAGIALEIPANELVCRELPKRRKGRPAKSDDSVVDEDSVPKKAKKAKSPAASDDEKPKKKTKAQVKAESDSESESEVEAPKPKAKAEPKAKEAPKKKVKDPEPESESEVEKPKKKAKSPAASEDEAPKKAKKSPAASDDEAPKKKVKSPAASEDEKPKKKATKAEKPKAEEPKAKAPKAKKSPAASEDEKPKKASPAASEDEAPKKAKKVKSPAASEDEAPKKPKKAKVPEPVPEPEPEVLEVEEEEEEDVEDQEIEIGGKDYILRNGKFICDKDEGTILGTVNDEGEAEWSEDA